MSDEAEKAMVEWSTRTPRGMVFMATDEADANQIASEFGATAQVMRRLVGPWIQADAGGLEVSAETSSETGHDWNFDSFRARIGALEAAISGALELADAHDWAEEDWLQIGRIRTVLSLAPSVVLDGMIREAKAEALEEAAGFVWPNNGSDAQYQASVYLRGRAAEYRNGDA